MKIFFAENELLCYYESGQDNDNLPVPVYTHIRPYVGHQFIIHTLLSLGVFYTEVDMTMHITLFYALSYTKIIGTNDDKHSLKQYSRYLLWSFIEEQLVSLQNLFREINSFIINAAHIFHDVIINNSIPITYTPPVL